jgi:ubiquinone/menaquinone biosynthesis C-methylase UbiE
MPRLMAALYDPVMRLVERRGLAAWRAELLAETHGSVLEVGAGTGLNLPYYPGAVTTLVLAEPDPHMRSALRRRVGIYGRRLTISDADADSLPFADGGFDTVVMTLLLCTVPDVSRALAEARRVLAPGGTLAFIEHVGGPEGSRRLRWQQRVEPAWRRVAGGCRLTRRTVESIEDAGFIVQWVKREDLPGALSLGSPVVRGVASTPDPDPAPRSVR